jgi:hypothetical protein
MSTYQTGPLDVLVTFNGSNGPSGISVPGLQVGDVVNWAHSPQGGSVAAFETFVSVADEIQQTAGYDASSFLWTMQLTRWSA